MDQSFSAKIGRGTHAAADRLVLFGSTTKPALFIGAAFFAYLNQPVMRFIDAYAAYEGAAVTALSLMLLVPAITVRRDFAGIVVGVAGFVLGLVWVGNAVDGAVARAARNDSRCYRIEIEMLGDKPPRADLPELYQALGCRPMSSLYMSPEPGKR